MSNPMKRLLIWAGSAWILFIAVRYYQYHPLYISSFREVSAVVPALVIAVLYIIIALYFQWYRDKKEITWELNFWKVLALLSVLTYVIMLVLFLARGLTSDISFGIYAWRLLKNFVLLTLVLTLCTSICAALGCAMLRMTGFQIQDRLTSLMLGTGVGLLVIEFALFLLALGGALNRWTTLGTLLLSVVIALPEAVNLLKDSWRSKTLFTWKPWSLTGIMGVVLLFTVGLNTIHVLRPIPNGWDEFVRYLNTPKLLAVGGHLFSGINAYPHELFMSIGFTLFNSLPIALGLSLIAGILSCIALYVLARQFVSAQGSFTAAALFYILPFVVFQSSRELKVDLAATFFAAVALIAFMQWWHTRTDRWILLSGLLAGGAFATKYTSIFFLVALGSALLYALYRHGRWKAVIRGGIFFACAAALPYLPWAGYFIGTTHNVSINTLVHGAYDGPQAACIAPPAHTESSVAEPPVSTAPVATGTKEELDRYAGYQEGVRRYLSAPWVATMNPIVRGTNVDIGFIFLALFPPLLFFVPWRKKGKELTVERAWWVSLGIYTVTYWILWLVFAHGVIWYGLPGLIGLVVLLMGMLENEHTPAVFGRLGSWVLILFTLVVGVSRIYAAPPDPQLIHLAGGLPFKDYLDTIMPGYRDAAVAINDTTSTPEQPNYIYRIGTFLPYFIANNQERIYTDDQMDMLTCIRSGRTDAEAVAELKRQGFRFILFDLGIPTIDATADQSLSKKWKDTADFINKNLKIVVLQDKGKTKIALAELP